MKKVVVLWVLIAIVVITGVIFVRGDVVSQPYYGGMGMGGYGYCHDDDDDISYEWLYAHLSENDQILVDQQYALLLSQIDFTILTAEEQQTQIELVKTQLVDYIYDQDFLIYGRS
jgi:hypothetical protein